MAVWFLANAAANYLAGFMSSLYPEEGKPTPQLFGYQITDLYSFFMVFVFAASIAAVILFLVNRKLVKMMNAPV